MNYTKMFCDFGNAIVGLDIGGANLKAAVWLGPDTVLSASMYFPMWKQPERLAVSVRDLLDKLGATGHLAVTMTGELADCFATRSEGVAHIVHQLLQVVSPDQLSIYTVDGRWLMPKQALDDPWTVAASNWHALATWLAQWPTTSRLFKSAILVDIGSTTVDILPVINGRLATQARTDRDRLERSQLVYTGVRRTPVCAVLQSFVIDDAIVPTMAEFFATVDDAYLLLDFVDEDVDDCDTADGRPRTKSNAAERLARMIGEDAARLTQTQLSRMANQVVDAQAKQVAQAIEVNLGNLNNNEDSPHLVYSGHGWPLLEQAIRNLSSQYRIVRLNELISDEASRCAPAAAVAWLRQLSEF